MDAICWFLIFVGLLIFEIFTLGLTTIWFAGGALVSFILSVVGVDNIWIQLVVFIVTSIILLIFTRPVVSKYINKRTVKTNVDEVIGKQGRVIEGINNIDAKGVVVLDGMEWMARSEDDSLIEEDEIVTVVRVEGVKLIVKKLSR